MANIYDCALVYTPQLWVEKFHRHCTNSGQLKIRSFIYDSTVLFSDEYDVVIVSDTWPALSRALVERVKARGAMIIGVCDPSESSREFLSSIGIDGIIDSKLDAKNICDEIITLLNSLSYQKSEFQIISDSISGTDLEIEPRDTAIKYTNVTSVIGTGGSGATELGIVISSRLIDSLMIDLDFEHPSLAPRSNLNIEPHIIDAIESAQNNKENFLDVVDRTSKFSTIVGLTHASLATDLRDYEVQSLIDESKDHFTNVVLDCGNVSGYSSFLYLYETIFVSTNTFVIVGDCSPHGIIRILEILVIISDHIIDHNQNEFNKSIEIIINNAPQDVRLQHQIVEEISFCSENCQVSFIPTNKNIREMSWIGSHDYPNKWLKNFDNLVLRISSSSSKFIDTVDDLLLNEELVSDSL